MPHTHEPKDRNVGQWIEANDRIRLAAYSSVASLVVLFSGYFRKANGEVIPIQEEVRPTSDRAVTEKPVHYGAGFLLSLVAHLGTGNANRGQCYVSARVQRSTGTPLVVLAELLGGYVTDEYQPSFPYGKIEGSLEGPGYIYYPETTDPAAGVQPTFPVPQGARWRLLAARAVLVTSADVANRRVGLQWVDASAGESRALWYAGTDQPASKTYIYSFSAVGVQHAITDTFMSVPIAPYVIGTALDSFNFNTVNFNANDNYAVAYGAVEEWIEG